MSVSKLGIILFSGILIFATAPLVSSQSTQDQSQDQTKKTQKGKAKKDTGKTVDKNVSGTEEKSGTEETTQTGKTGAKKAKKTSSMPQDKVREIQMSLKNQGFDPGPMDGRMGPMTMTALRNYQSHNQLQVTGTLTPETENALMSGATAQTGRGKLSPRSSLDQNQQSNDQDQTYNQTQQSYNQNQPDLDRTQQQTYDQNQQSYNQDQQSGTQYGQANQALGTTSEPVATSVDDVKQIQQSLTDLGYKPGEVNGMMTTETQNAIRQFQQTNSLPVTGVMDEQTKSALDTQVQRGTASAQLGQAPLNAQSDREKPAELEQNNAGTYDQNRSDTYAQNQERANTTDTQTRVDSAQNRSDCGYNRTQSTVTTSTCNHDQVTTTDSRRYKPDNDKDKTAKHHEKTGKHEKDASDRIEKAAAVLQELTTSGDKGIPNDMLQNAQAVVVIPHMVKGAFGIGGRYGKGVVSERQADGRWSAPAFIDIGGASYGFQLGASATDLVLVFKDRKGLDTLEGGKDMKLGVDAGVVAGPVGRSAEAGTNAKLESSIYAWSRSKGLYAGVALDGAVLYMDNDMNRQMYGDSVEARQILNGSVAPTAAVQPWMNALEQAVPKGHISQK